MNFEVEPLEQKQSYIPPSKLLMCGMNALGVQWHTLVEEVPLKSDPFLHNFWCYKLKIFSVAGS